MSFKNQVSLAPMAKITDVAFRSLCVKSGVDMTVSELTSCEGIVRNQENSLKQLTRADNENNYAIQLFGGDPKTMSEAAFLVEKKCNIIDINMGCPVSKVMDNGGGCQLTGQPLLAKEIASSIIDSVSIPVSAKIRLGINKPDKAQIIAKELENAGVSFITIHGRTQAQKYSGQADWNIIKQVANSVSIPVIGNGDISSPEIAKDRLDNFDVKGIAIGRGASGNPYLFTQIKDFLKNGNYDSLDTSKRIYLFNEYIKLAKKYDISFIHQKIQAQHITRGLEGSAKIRLALNDAKNSEELTAAINDNIN